MEFRKINNAEFFYFQEPLPIVVIPRQGDDLYLLDDQTDILSEWEINCSPNEGKNLGIQSFSMFNCLQEGMKDLFDLEIFPTDLKSCEIYSVWNEYLIIYPVFLSRLRVKFDVEYKALYYRDFPKNKLSPLIKQLIKNRIIRDPDYEFRWVTRKKAKSVEFLRYSQIKGSTGVSRAGLIPYISDGTINTFFLGYKNLNKSSLTDWGGGCKLSQSEVVATCLEREFTEEFDYPLSELYDLAPETLELSKIAKINDKDGNFSFLLFVELADFDELRRHFHPSEEILGYRIINQKEVMDNLYTGLIDGSLAYQFQEIERFGGLKL